MKCPHCGSLNKDDAKFCKNCGNPINNSSLAYQDKFGKNQSVKEEGSSKSKNILIVCITVIICVAIVAGALIYMNSNSDNDAHNLGFGGIARDINGTDGFNRSQVAGRRQEAARRSDNW